MAGHLLGEIGARTAAPAECTADLETQIRRLVFPGFLRQTPSDRLDQFGRYFRAVGIRLERLRVDPAKDLQRVRELAPYQSRRLECADDPDARRINRRELETYRWMLEEWRISLFAQEVGTRGPISAKRLDRQWDKVTARIG
jgi:ATP-dependent helicase HrpA